MRILRRNSFWLAVILVVALAQVPHITLRAQGNAIDPIIAAIVDAAMGSLSQKLGKPQSRNITPWHVQGDAFSDSGLDCPAPGKTVEKRVVRGYRIRLTAFDPANPKKNIDYQYRATLDGSQLFECTAAGPGSNIPVTFPAPAAAANSAASPNTPPQAALIVKNNQLLNGPKALGSMRWTAGGKLIGVAADSKTGTVAIVDPLTGQTLQPLGVTGVVGSWLNPDGKFIAALSSDGKQWSLQTFDTAAGQKIADFPIPASAIQGLTSGNAVAVAWSTASSHLAMLAAGELVVWTARGDSAGDFQLDSAGASLQNSLLLWKPDGKSILVGYGPAANATPTLIDVATGSSLFAIDKLNNAGAQSATWGPNGRSIAVILKDRIAIFNGATGDTIRETLHGHSIQWNADGSQLAVATDSHTVAIYDAKSGAVSVTLQGGSTTANVAVFSPDGKRIATGDDDGMVRIWDVATGKLLIALAAQHPDGVSAILWKPDGSQLLSADSSGALRLWNLPQS